MRYTHVVPTVSTRPCPLSITVDSDVTARHQSEGTVQCQADRLKTKKKKKKSKRVSAAASSLNSAE